MCSIKKVGGRRFAKGLYQALFSFRLACRNEIFKAKIELDLRVNNLDPSACNRRILEDSALVLYAVSEDDPVERLAKKENHVFCSRHH